MFTFYVGVSKLFWRGDGWVVLPLPDKATYQK